MNKKQNNNQTLKPIQRSKFETFENLIKESRKFAKQANLKQSDVAKLITEVRSKEKNFPPDGGL